MATLSKAQKEDFWRDGYLVVEDVVDAALLRTMQNNFSGWVEERMFGANSVDNQR
jgi:ectoine hydroxylase-related dioxygenase (phytanoyl-CoA dioxygenase family)|tara:strand:- start:472 stop:636 length:165 start_codon:yes stop_codon:yes gene_type:complete